MEPGGSKTTAAASEPMDGDEENKAGGQHSVQYYYEYNLKVTPLHTEMYFFV